MNAEKKSLIERWGAMAVAITSIFGLVFLLFPHLRPRDTTSTPPAPPHASPASGDVIIGTWRQLVQDRRGSGSTWARSWSARLTAATR
jgi:hypothetical protein